MSAWQHPLERCDACGQDILLHPDITSDVRLTYVEYCPRCDADEPVVTPRQRAPWADRRLDAESFWAMTGQELELDATPAPSPAATVAPTAAGFAPQPAQSPPTPKRTTAPAEDVDLWWDGGDDGRHRAADPLDVRWARFVNAGEDDDDLLGSEGSFAFGGEEAPRRRRSWFRLRESA
jgi:hypothetical protein